MVKKWFRKAVYKRKPYHSGWKKSDSETKRRSKTLASRPKNWSMKKRYRSAGQSLIALSNVNPDKATKKKARADAKYFFKKLKR